jgi:hypothetical protein
VEPSLTIPFFQLPWEHPIQSGTEAQQSRFVDCKQWIYCSRLSTDHLQLIAVNAGKKTLGDMENIRRGRWAIPESSRMNADDRLSLDPLGRVEGGDGIVEGSHVADVCPQPTISDPLDGLTQLGAIGYDTSVPPARIRAADRFAMSPPRTSKTRSTPPTSSRASFSRSTNSCAPKSAPSDGRQRARCR